MASYQVTFWKHIPSQVKAWDGTVEAKGMMPDRFQVAIDAYSMREGSTDMDAYLEGWRRGPVEERGGHARGSPGLRHPGARRGESENAPHETA